MRGCTMILLAMTAPGAQAVAQTAGTATARLFDDVTACRAETDPAKRLQCYDRTVPMLDASRRNRDIVVIDRAQIRETRKTLFGLTLPRLPVLEQNADGKAGNTEISRIETTIASADIVGHGQWRFVLADGATWLQTDDNVVARRPRAGDSVIIKRGALGSFKMNVTGQPAIKVRRQK